MYILYILECAMFVRTNLNIFDKVRSEKSALFKDSILNMAPLTYNILRKSITYLDTTHAYNFDIHMTNLEMIDRK